MQTEILNRALDNFEQETGLEGKWREMNIEYDGQLTLAIKKERIRFHVEIKKDLRLYQLDKLLDVAKRHKPFMVIADTMLNNVREKLKEEGIAYIDASGNAHIAEGQVLIVVKGRKNLHDQKEFKPATNRAFTKTGLKVVFHFLNNPAAIDQSYRQIAAETNIALGNVKYIMDGLREAGFIIQLTKNKVKLQHKKMLLDRWITGYRETLKPAIFKGAFEFVDNKMYKQWNELNIKKLQITWGGEPAAELVTGYLKAKELAIYSNEKRSGLMTTLKLVPRQDGDILVYDKFWKQNEKEHGELAPMILIYADLLITDDPRCIETAKMIFDKYLKNELETG